VRQFAAAPTAKTFEGNTPALVSANVDGALTLLATNCEIHGRTLAFKKQPGSLASWQSADDRAVWKVDVPKTGKYAVWLEWSCDNGSAGNMLTLDVGEALTTKVASTGSGETYRYAKIGEIILQSGRQTIVARSAGAIEGALMELKGIKLVPIVGK
jgi:hypothetical protein